MRARVSFVKKYASAVLIVSFMAACGGGGGAGSDSGPLPKSSPVPTPTRTPLAAPVVAGALLPAAGQLYFGAYVNPSGLVGGNTPDATAQFESQVGRPLALHMQYEQFTANFSGRAVQDDFANWRVPVVSWNCEVSNAEIVAGLYDATIQLKATQARTFGWPVFVRYFWDPNLTAGQSGRTSCYDSTTDDPGGVFSASEFIAAWNHVRAIFSAAGATNVVWLWTVSAQPGAPSVLQYYPGAASVDWVGIDDYNTTDGSFSAPFSSTYAALAPLNKPILISELGVPSSSQTPFFSNAVASLTTNYPMVSGFMYYDSISYLPAQNADWRLTAEAMPSFDLFANDPRMAARYVP